MKRILCLWGEQWCRSSINMCRIYRGYMCSWVREWAHSYPCARWIALTHSRMMVLCRGCECVCVSERCLLREVNVMQFFVIFMLLLAKTLRLDLCALSRGCWNRIHTHYIHVSNASKPTLHKIPKEFRHLSSHTEFDTRWIWISLPHHVLVYVRFASC